MSAQKRKATNIDDIDVDAELEAGPSTNPYLKRGRTGTVEAGSRAGSIAPNTAAADGEGDDDDDEAIAMADDDYSAQLSWQSQSKENMKLLLSSFSPEQLARYETYRRSTLNKQTVRRFIHQSLGSNVSVNVAQVIAGFSKVFVGEIIELGTSARSAAIAASGHSAGAPHTRPPAYGVSTLYPTDGSCRFGEASKGSSFVRTIVSRRNDCVTVASIDVRCAENLAREAPFASGELGAPMNRPGDGVVQPCEMSRCARRRAGTRWSCIEAHLSVTTNPRYLYVSEGVLYTLLLSESYRIPRFTMSCALTFSTLPSELQLCVLGHLSTRRLLRQVTRLSKHWYNLVCKLIRQRALRLLSRSGVGLVFETSTPSNFDSKTYTLTPHGSGLFDESTCNALPHLLFTFASSSATFEFNLDEDEYFGSFLWSVSLSMSRSIQYRVSPPASPKLLAFDRTVRQNYTVQNGLDRLRRCEFPAEGEKARSEERELTGDHGSAISLKTQLLPAHTGNFKTLLESLRMDASSLLVAYEDTQRSNDMMVFFCR
ncbi:unnamed protein product [Rhizoctonia solani]|uniref:F-box domain-containing protein n=1 Tax=Rhizoctonia solani TaxID=456999 RepID=A0A8H3B5F0_9AGAM|nr:unnamed protein product [Rhizoctonia solani]